MNSQKRNNQGPRATRRGGRQLGGGGRRMRSAGGPPEFISTPSVGKTFRFTNATAVVSLPITRNMLLNLMTVATTTTNQARIFDAVKLKRVRCWGEPPALGSAPTSLQVEWLGNQAPSTIHSDTAIGVRPAFVDTRPPLDSSDRWWSISGTNGSEVLFNYTGPAGSIVDVMLSFRLNDDEAAIFGEAGTAAGATIGVMYYNYLDGFASKKLAPVGGVNILP